MTTTKTVPMKQRTYHQGFDAGYAAGCQPGLEPTAGNTEYGRGYLAGWRAARAHKTTLTNS